MIRRILMIAFSVLPAIVLMVYIYKKDKVEKEPLGLLFGLLGLGAAAAFPASFIESGLESVLNLIFSPLELFGEIMMDPTEYVFYQLADNFLCIALVEEGLKWLILWLFTRNNPNFNCMFDGMVYSVFVSMGFAALENVFYGVQYGWSTILLRAVTAVPAHLYFSILMGYFYSYWHAYKKAQILEQQYRNAGYLPSSNRSAFNTRGKLFCSIFFPVAAHGFYDFYCSMDSVLATVVFYMFLIGLALYCFFHVSRLSKLDDTDYRTAVNLMVKKYPEAASFLCPDLEKVKKL